MNQSNLITPSDQLSEWLQYLSPRQIAVFILAVKFSGEASWSQAGVSIISAKAELRRRAPIDGEAEW